MSAPVDVLAVWDKARVAVSPQRPLLRYDMKEARAAVAELMDKADSLLVLGAGDTGIRELRAALARCKGESK